MRDLHVTSPIHSSNLEDLLDRLSLTIPWHRSLTVQERIIILITCTCISIVGCILLCLVCSRSPLKRRYYSGRKTDNENDILITTASKQAKPVHAATYYESIVKSNGTVSDSDGGQSNNSMTIDESSSYPESIDICAYPVPPFSQINVDFNIDTRKHLLIIHLANAQNITKHPAFDKQAKFFIHVQMFDNDLLKRLYEAKRNRRSNLELQVWKQQQEKTTRRLLRTASNTLICDDYLQFEINTDNIMSTSLRFLIFCIDRTTSQDLIFESVLALKPSMIPHYQHIIEFKSLPEIAIGEIFLGLSYFPTAERFTIMFEKLHFFCKIEKYQKIDAQLITTCFYHGRRFFQKKLSFIVVDGSQSSSQNTQEIQETISQIIPISNIQSVYVHMELIMHVEDRASQSIVSCGSILLGERTRYQTEWYKMLQQHRQTHHGWYQFFG